MTEIDAAALKEYCGNCGEDHIHTSHGRCLGCFRRGEQRVAERLAEETGESVGTFTHEGETPELDELESVE